MKNYFEFSINIANVNNPAKEKDYEDYPYELTPERIDALIMQMQYKRDIEAVIIRDEYDHKLEDMLYHSFVRHVAKEPGALGDMARKILTTETMRFVRMYR